MYNKLLNKVQEELIESTTVEFDNGTQWVLDFFLQFLDNETGIYGVKICMSTLDGVLMESDETFVSESKEEALAMLTAFAEGKVLPMSLLYVVDDWDY